MKNTNKYVYKLNATGKIYANLEAVVQAAIRDFREGGYAFDYFCGKERRGKLSKPLVTKIRGGYLVTVVDYNGNVYRRTIDVFAPATFFDRDHKAAYFMDKRTHGTTPRDLEPRDTDEDEDEDEEWDDEDEDEDEDEEEE